MLIRLKSPCRWSAVGTVNSTTAVQALAQTFPSAEVKQLVLLDRSADRKAGDRHQALGRFRIAEEEVLRAEHAVVVEQKGGAMEVVGAGLGRHGDGRTAGHALLGVEVVRGDVYGLDRLRRSDVGRVVRQPDVDVGGAVELRDVVVAVGAVDVGRERAAGVDPGEF